MRGTIGAASIGITSCASALEFDAAAMGEAESARKDNSSWAVTRPADAHVALASFLLVNMPGTVSKCRASKYGA